MQDSKLDKYYRELKTRGLPPEQEKKILAELTDRGSHDIPGGIKRSSDTGAGLFSKSIYDWNDLATLQAISSPSSTYAMQLRSIDDLLEKDKQREEDGFPRKIRVGKMIRPGKGGKDKVVVIPTTVE